MIQFNLLPDVKLEFIKATYRRRIITILSVAIAGGFIFIFVLMFLFVRVNQTGSIKDLDKDIGTKLSELRENPDLDKILTIQSQLASLPKLHEEKVMSSRIFDVLSKVTPNNVAITNIDIDFEENTAVIKGTADQLATINKFVDTIKFTEFTVDGNVEKSENAFTSVVLEQFSINSSDGGDENISFEVSFEFSDQIFKNTAEDGKPLANTVKLTVPSIITTRSEIQKPTDLFKADPNNDQQEGGN